MALLVCNSFAISSNNLLLQPKKRSNNLLSVVACVKPQPIAPTLNRNSFPKDFIFGTSSAAYQYEGAAKKYGRGLSIWDTFSHEHPEMILDGSNGDVAVDQYHRYKEDVKIMKDMNMDAYRLSISWSRILPNGRRRTDADVNEAGIDYYNNLINELLANGLKPFVTLFHWDLPQTLQDEYGGFLSEHILSDYEDYVKLCFERFGDRVKHWITLNEPMIFTAHGFAYGGMAPGRSTQSGGDSGREPYIVGHNLLHAHAKAVQLYKKNFQKSQKGVIGIALNTRWFLPQSKHDADNEAANRALDFEFGWFLKPLALGHYPKSMISQVGDRLPKFTAEEVNLIHGSYDFIGLNYYSGTYASNKQGIYDPPSYGTDSLAEISQSDVDGKLIGPVSGSGRVSVYPEGIRALLNYVKEECDNPSIYITENGIDELDNPKKKLEEVLYDPHRVDYYSRHLSNIHSAIRDDDVNLKGYFAWSLMDNYEWSNGYAVRFGLNFVDYKDNLKRHPKLSAEWLKSFLKKH